jgi:hypothetical protein
MGWKNQIYLKGLLASWNIDWGESTNLRQFDGEVDEEDEFCAFPLLFVGGNLSLKRAMNIKT